MLGRWYRGVDKGLFLFVELPALTFLLVAGTVAAALGAISWAAPLAAVVGFVFAPLQWREIKRREQRAR